MSEDSKIVQTERVVKTRGRGNKSPIPLIERQKIYWKTYYAKNGEAVRAKARESGISYYTAHQEEILAKAKVRNAAKKLAKLALQEANNTPIAV